ncbi:UPF0738 family protein [Robertmurraya andreesenii]|uniref:Uncharacterized protein n=1 Tax=Anoxybacillus andreesenii TaxID=1325932 RepID=A0ABT9UYZ0_9BACL|nr:hypothetical protein [Robertmurraya andreesenii]MDQ0153914.1 hypothetical protein [Robertmurraya andreesenii]
MRKKIMINGFASMSDNECLLQVGPEINLDGIIATGQMLVDSDECAFVYLLEKEQDYTYVIIQEPVWTDLKRVLAGNLRVFLGNEEERIELVNFLDELAYLIENIKGNSNYGEIMVAKVEEIF